MDTEGQVSDNGEKLGFSEIVFAIFFAIMLAIPIFILPNYFYGDMFSVIGESLFPLGRFASLSFGLWSVGIIYLALERTLCALISLSVCILIPLIISYLTMSLSLSMDTNALIEGYEIEVTSLNDNGRRLLREDIELAKTLGSEGVHIGLPFVASSYRWNIDKIKDGTIDPKSL